MIKIFYPERLVSWEQSTDEFNPTRIPENITREVFKRSHEAFLITVTLEPNTCRSRNLSIGVSLIGNYCFWMDF